MTYNLRLGKELESLQNDPIENVDACPIDPNNLLRWRGILMGPPDSPYEGGKFHLSITFSEEYPQKPPKVRFETKVYHPNINQEGAICLDILSEAWNPALTIGKVLLSVQLLLVCPEPDDPLVLPIAAVFKNDINRYNENARQWTL